jgi:hypothetical protein
MERSSHCRVQRATMTCRCCGANAAYQCLFTLGRSVCLRLSALHRVSTTTAPSMDSLYLACRAMPRGDILV